MRGFKKYWEENEETEYEELWERIKKVVKKTILSVHSNILQTIKSDPLLHSQQYFNILGIDIDLDQNNHLYIIESNVK